MDQGPVRPPPPPPWSRRDLGDLARAVGVLWGIALLLAGSVTVAWVAFSDLGVGEVLTPAVLVVAALLPMFGVLSRFIDASTKGWTDTQTIGRRNSFYGDQDVAGLTTIGVFLFVSVPMALLVTLVVG